MIDIAPVKPRMNSWFVGNISKSDFFSDIQILIVTSDCTYCDH